jgi:hypothetical protein
MATTKRLEKYIVRDAVSSRRAQGALVGKRLVTQTGTTDPEGGSVKAYAALSDRPYGYIEDDCPDLGTVGVVTGAGSRVPITCGDATIDIDVEVFNDAAGRVSSVQGAGAFFVGVTRSKTDNLDELVTVELALPARS